MVVKQKLVVAMGGNEAKAWASFKNDRQGLSGNRNRPEKDRQGEPGDATVRGAKAALRVSSVPIARHPTLIAVLY